jgi:triose/dihydroxyacetone kinase / FAD-AMP lyase (cyclizing)
VPLPDGLRPIQPIPSRPTTRRARPDRTVLPDPDRGRGRPERARREEGDGDTGSTLATAARALIGALDRLPLADHTQLYRAIGLELSQTMGGSSGVLLAIFFAAAGDASASGQDPIGALKAGLDRIQQVGGARPATAP